jgi:hypothetical protein
LALLAKTLKIGDQLPHAPVGEQSPTGFPSHNPPPVPSIALLTRLPKPIPANHPRSPSVRICEDLWEMLFRQYTRSFHTDLHRFSQIRRSALRRHEGILARAHLEGRTPIL